MSLGAAIGALTFTGSIIAFLKLDGRMSGKPIMLPSRHLINIALAVLLVVLIVVFVTSTSTVAFWCIVLTALALGVLIIVPIGGADMPVVVSMLKQLLGLGPRPASASRSAISRSSSRGRSWAPRARSCPTSCARG